MRSEKPVKMIRHHTIRVNGDPVENGLFAEVFDQPRRIFGICEYGTPKCAAKRDEI